jgi:hypothetical protein
MAAAGYPAAPRKGDVITGCPPPADDLKVFHAGTTLADGQLRHQRRPRAVRHRAGRLGALAQQRAYEGVRSIRFDGAAVPQRHRPPRHQALTNRAPQLPGVPGAHEHIDTTAVRDYLLGLQHRIVSTPCRPKTASPSSATAGRARPAAGCRATACRSWSKKATCWSAAAATSAT